MSIISSDLIMILAKLIGLVTIFFYNLFHFLVSVLQSAALKETYIYM